LYIDKSLVKAFHKLEKEKYWEAPILTYGESATFDKDGGAMRISLEGSKHTITVNIDAIERKRLKVSTKLLEYAEVVRDKT
jgi:hypothetical protein